MLFLSIKRFWRGFKKDFLRYFAQIVLITVVVGVIVALESIAITIIDGRSNNAEIECIEDGQFSTLFPVSEEDLLSLSDSFNVEIQKNYYIDINEAGHTYRLYKQREKIDTLVLRDGRVPSKRNELVVEQNYADHYGLVYGDKLDFNGKTYTICGTGSLPDYVHSVKNANDAGAASYNYCWVVLSDKEFSEYLEDESYAKEYNYAYIANEDTDITVFSDALFDLKIKRSDVDESDGYTKVYLSDLSDDELNELSNTLSFTKREDNRRMDLDLYYAYIYGDAGFIMGILLIAMLAFIFAVVTRNQVYNDHNVIGSLYALGVKKSSIMTFYLMPGVLISFIGGLIGFNVGYLPVLSNISLGAFHNVNSFPYYDISHPDILYIYALVMPPLVNLVVNFFVLNKALSHSALSLIRGTYEAKKNLNIKLEIKDFVRCFQVRRIIEERGSLIVFVSVLVSITMLMLGLSTHAMITNNIDAIQDNVQYEYLCALKYPVDDLETKGEKLFIKNVKSQYYGKDISFSLVGVSEDNELFAAKPEKDINTAVAGKSVASKFNLKEGDSISFKDDLSGDEYTVTISKIVESGSSLELYMNIESMYEMFDKDEGYLNAVAFVGRPDIPDELIYSEIRTSDVVTNVKTLTISMTPFMYLSCISSISIFLITMYLVVSTMIDRSSFGMALLKVFGYEYYEIQGLYVNSIIYSVSFALLLAIPVGKFVCNRLCPYVFQDMAIGMFFKLPFSTYILVALGAILLFLGILLMLVKKVKEVDTSAVLKCRE